MASPQPTDSHTRLSNELYSQILMRDFSKRQRSILDLIIRLSYGCGKKSAFIPKLEYFEICGVHQKVVASELNGLKTLNVVQMDSGTKTYWINKDYETWLTEPPTERQEVSLSQLVAANIRMRTDQQNIGVDQQNVGEHQNGQQNIGQDTNKTLVDSPIKHWCSEPAIPHGSKAETVPITKDNYIDKKISIEKKKREDVLFEYQLKIQGYGQHLFQPYGISSGTAYSMAELLVKEMLPVELAQEALRITKSMGADEGLAKVKLLRWLQSGVKDVPAAEEYEQEVFGTKHESDGGADVEHKPNFGSGTRTPKTAPRPQGVVAYMQRRLNDSNRE